MANIRIGLDTADYESGIKKLDVRDFIFQLEPDEAPFTTMLSRVRKESTRDVAYSWFEDISIGKWTQINHGGGYTSGDTSLVVDDADIFQVGDLVKSVTSGEIMKVATVTVGTQTITVSRAFGTTVAASIADDAYLFRLGQSLSEGYTVGNQLITSKSKIDNYIQIFSRPVQLTQTANAVATYGGNRRMYERKKVGVDIKRDIEAQFLFGEPKYDSSGPSYATGGVLYFMGSDSPALNAAGPLYKDDFDGWLKDAFSYGSSEKVLFASPLLISQINGWVDSYMWASPGEIKTWGVRFRRYTSAFGDVLIVLNRNFLGPYAGQGVLLDMKEIVYRYLEGLDLTLQTNLQPPNVKYFLDEYAGHIGLELHNDLKHARIYGVTA
jgi:hypothetical protein